MALTYAQHIAALKEYLRTRQGTLARNVPVLTVVHGAEADTPRPPATVVHWYGSVAPANAQPRDEWIQEEPS